MSPPTVSASLAPLLISVSTALFLVMDYPNLLKLSKYYERHDSHSVQPRRSQLPNTLLDWRKLFDLDDEENNRIKSAWYLLFDLFKNKYGVVLWENMSLTHQRPWAHDDKLPRPNGYNTFSHSRLDKELSKWPYWCPNSGAQHAARTATGCDVMVRVVTSGGTGQNHRSILRYLNRTPDVLLSTNHFLPMLVEMEFEDITFAVFPRLDDLHMSFTCMLSNSLEDVLYMTMEALEGIVYLHEHRIAHQDLFLMNFLVQWQPESLIKRGVNRPRVYIIDFEDAVMFPEDTPTEEMVTTFPRVIAECARALAPEVYLQEPYSPFKMDVWQFAQDLKKIDIGFPEITQIFQDMSRDAPNERITAAEGLCRLDSFVRSQPPLTLHIPFRPFDGSGDCITFHVAWTPLRLTRRDACYSTARFHRP